MEIPQQEIILLATGLKPGTFNHGPFVLLSHHHGASTFGNLEAVAWKVNLSFSRTCTTRKTSLTTPSLPGPPKQIQIMQCYLANFCSVVFQVSEERKARSKEERKAEKEKNDAIQVWPNFDENVFQASATFRLFRLVD